MTVADGDSPLRRLEVVVHGHVQGVGFRVFVWRRAASLGLVGWVENEGRGSVRAVAEGPEAELRALLAALRDGPPGARVDGVAESWSPASGSFGDFEVRSGWHGGD